MSCQTTTRCRACGKAGLKNVLNLGRQPLANGLKRKAAEREARYPLTVAVCPSCRLVQLRETVDRHVLFDRYFWVTGTSSSARAFAETFCDRAAKTAGLKQHDLVLEVASNDGTFLKPFAAKGWRVHGVDPAQNVVAQALDAGVPTWARYWDAAVAQEFLAEVGRPKLIFARNVVAHAQDLDGFIDGFRVALGPDGVGALEYHSAVSILEGLQYDSIYHEHLCYFGVRSISVVLERFGLHPFHADPSPISGGATVVVFSAKKRPESKALKALRAKEKKTGIEEVSSWVDFGRRCYAHRDASRALLAPFKRETVVGFGTSARSSTYLNFCGFGRKQVRAAIDNNPMKQGLFSPGGAIPIVSKKEGFALKPGLLFLFAWNFKKEILDECRKHGYKGRVLIPFPERPTLTAAGVSR
ncbi:MAG: class I SAM-dependent methyltransferase [Elusimicrobia bacterium]|nr:class I SAM-dependent methyltransferase [Elusimicrobiota bacterium]